MTYFNIDPKINKTIHPNGIKKIKRISYGTSAELIILVKELCDDPTLDLMVGDGVTNLVFEKLESDDTRLQA